MKLKGYSYIAVLIIALLATVAAYSWFAQSPYYDSFQKWSNSHRTLLFVSLILVKAFGVVWPPLPGGILTLGSIPFLGWFGAYLTDLIGGTLGAVIAYYLGKKYGYTFLTKLLHEDVVKKIQAIKIKKHREIHTTFMLRILGGGTLNEAVCYGAGLIGIHFINFLIGMVLSHIVVGIPAFYLAQFVFQPQKLWMNVTGLLITLPLLYKFRNRFLE